MEYRGRVKGGVVVLEAGATLPEGAEVRVAPVTVGEGEAPTIWQKLRALAGSAPDLPPDAARNHDHYLYGTPKREPGE
jgi:hypothetical protein